VLSARANFRRRLSRFEHDAARARAIASVLASIPGISVQPDLPHTNVMHVSVRGSAESLMEASADVARTDRVLLFRRLIPTCVPDVTAFEVSVVDAAGDPGDDEVERYFTRIPGRVAQDRSPLVVGSARRRALIDWMIASLRPASGEAR
jgi:threonine aldolase